MSLGALPTRSGRYLVAMTSEAVALEDERGESIHSLAARLVAGDESALEQVYDRWSALVHTFALKAVLDPHDAEDITQQVFVAAWRSRHTLTPSPVALPAWLIGIARHKVADVRAARARDAERIAAVVAVPEPRAGSSEDPDLDIAERLVVRQAVQDMPDPRRTIVFLAFWEDLTHAEIADSTGLPLGTVKSHVRRGLIELHQQLAGVRHGAR